MVQLSQVLRGITLSILAITVTSHKAPKASTTATPNVAISTSTPVGSAGFAAADNTISFTLNIPENNTNDLYFSMSGPSKASWIAVGLGSSKMKTASLMIMAYSDLTGKNVTISPRLVSSHAEPSYLNISIETFEPTFRNNTTMTINAKCSNCQTWKGGSLDRTNTAAPFMWANGPSEKLESSDLNAAIKRHAIYGVFELDLTVAVGTPGVPMPMNSQTSKQTSEKTGDSDLTSIIHGFLMIVTFIILMPAGVIMLRVLDCPKWHGINQTISAGIGFVGAILGFSLGNYNRTSSFNSAHQIIGIVVVILMIGQFVLGFMHHHTFKKTQSTTWMAPIHVALGRVVIPAGVITGFLGFPLALNSQVNWLLLAVVAGVTVITSPALYWKWRQNCPKAKTVRARETEPYQLPSIHHRT